jgi:beta-galactosidase
MDQRPFFRKRPNGFIPFQYEITPFLNKSGSNIIAVKADHTQFADARWYTGSGIYRNVYLIATDPVHIDQWGISFTTPQVTAQKATAKVTVSLKNQTGTATPVVVTSRLLDNNGKTVAGAQQQITVKAGSSPGAEMLLKINNPSLWSTEHPALYKLVVTVNVKGKQVDAYYAAGRFPFIPI